MAAKSFKFGNSFHMINDALFKSLNGFIV